MAWLIDTNILPFCLPSRPLRTLVSLNGIDILHTPLDIATKEFPLIRRLPMVVFALTVLLYVVLSLVPFNDQIIELQPDGRNLGRIPGEYFRRATLGALSIPLLGMVLYCSIAKRFRSQDKRFGYAAFFIVVGFWIVTIFFRHPPPL